MKLNLCHNKRMSELRGECYFRSFNAFHQRENFHLISCRIFSYPRLKMVTQFENIFI